MHFVHVDPRRNLLHLIFVGQLDRASGARLLAEVAAKLPELRPGYHVLTDLRELQDVDRDGEQVVRELMDRCNAARPAALIRVLRDQTTNFGFTLMSPFHYGARVPVVTCLSLAEAVSQLPADPTGG